jgi:phage terminase large subunit
MFNQNYWDLINSKTRFVVNWGSAGSGKSYSTFQYIVNICLTKPKSRILGIRKVSSTLNSSCVSLVKDILNDWNISHLVSLNKTEKIFTFNNGSEILFKGIDDPEKIKSITGITNIIVEEASELDLEDIQQLNTRLRGQHAKNGQIIMCLNPVSEEHHIITDFIDRESERRDVTCFHSTYKDNKFLDDEYGLQLEAYKHTDMEFYRVYCLGLPGRVNKGGEAYQNFDRTKHVSSNINYDPTKNIIMSWDENHLPYSAVSLYHVDISNKKIDCFDELAVEDANIEGVCREFIKRYPNHISGLILLGDASLYAGTAKLEKGANTWTLILGHLKQYKPILKANRKNESVVMRLNWINNLFSTNDIEINISDKCVTLIKDLEYVKTNIDGTKFKKKEMCKIRKKAIEKMGHMCDNFDYALTGLFMKEYQMYQTGGVSNKPIFNRRKTSNY